jgi:hypothetical protein
MKILQYLQLIFTISKRCLPFDCDDQTPAYFSINDYQNWPDSLTFTVYYKMSQLSLTTPI